MSFSQRYQILLVTAAVTVLFSAYGEATSHKCVSKCYANVSLERISDVKRQMIEDYRYAYIHPHFLLGEYLENIHRDLFCREDENIRCEQEQPQLVEDIKADVIKNYTTFLNKNRKSSSCSTTYQVDYYPDRYPRYLVQVQCGDPTHKITLDNMLYLKHENSTWNIEKGRDIGIGCRCGSACPE